MSDEPIPPEPYHQACDAHKTGISALLDELRVAASIGMSEMLKIRAGGGLDTIDPKAFPQGAPNAQLAPASELKPSAFGWPDTDFAESNCVIDTYGTEPWLSLKAGDRAVDFELRDEPGASHSLAEFLSTKPVMLCFGMYTCPAYQASKEAEVKLALRHHEKVHFVHVYSVDPHPQADNSPDLGKPWELMYSTFRQPRDYETRVEMCRRILANHPSCQTMLIDAFGTNGKVNPVWSTYGPAPRPGFLIRQDGIIHTSQLWFTYLHMDRAIAGLTR